MKLYSIRNSFTGKFFRSTFLWNKGRTETWSDIPRYWLTPQGVIDNLKKIGSEQFPLKSFTSKKENLELYDVVTQCYGFKNFNAEKIKHMEVIVTNVEVSGARGFPAEEFIASNLSCG